MTGVPLVSLTCHRGGDRLESDSTAKMRLAGAWISQAERVATECRRPSVPDPDNAGAGMRRLSRLIQNRQDD